MKRRNAECGKIRRPIKRNKIAEQIGSNTLLYVKFLLLWAFVITADFLLEFRFEFLWPFWLLLRSVYDSFKYKGLAFSVLFVCIAITSDLVCLFFIPVQWLFFAASTYVWVQYVWHTDKGICLPTIILWILFVYLEAAIRWKDSRNIPHLDLCRPFAAHCIGYPVVTLGFGFKSYVGYRIRQRKQREVAKDNDFYMQLLQEALPKDESSSGVAAADVHNISGSSSTSATTTTAAPCDQQDHQLVAPQKELLVSSSSASSSSPSEAATQGGSSSSNHHATSSSSKNAQSHNSSKSPEVTRTTTVTAAATATSHANGHAGGGGSGSSAASLTSSTSNGGGSSNSAAMNGGVNHSKHLHRKSLDKDSSSSLSGKAGNSYSYHQQQQQQASSAKESSRSNDSSHTNGAAMSPKEKKECDSTATSSPTTTTSSKSHFDGVSSTTSSNNHDGSGGGGGRNKQNQQNGHVVGLEPELQQQQQQSNHVDNDPPVEPKASNRSGRKNRVKQKDNNSNHHNNNNSTTNAAASPKDNHSEPAPQVAATPAPPPPAPVVIQTIVKVCDSCARNEADAKKLRNEVGQLRQNENELRQKYDANTGSLKGCLQAKQKECDEVQGKYQELTAQRQQERQNLQTVERRLGEERRHRQSLESQLQNERKHRKQSEDKTTRLDMEVQKLRRDLISSEDAKHNAEKQNRNFEQEMRKFEAQLRNREPQQSAEVLMSALAAMQDKNATLEKNLSAETRVKLDLFSALGETRRQLEIASSSLRTKEKEILDLKAKIVQLVAVMPAMPNDALCLTGPGGPSSSGSGSGGSLMRLTDTPQLLSQSALNGGGGTGQPSPMSHLVMNNQPLMSQLSSLGVLTSTITTSTSGGCGSMLPPSLQQQQHQHQQQQQQGMVVATAAALVAAAAGGSNGGQIVQMQNSSQNCPSNLDPNASVYTPKNCSQTSSVPNNGPSSMAGGTEA